MSAIDWLNENSSTMVTLTPNEPPTTQSATQPAISVMPLEGSAKSIVGLIPPSVSGLPETLWQGSDTDDLATLIADLPVEETPAMQSLLYTLLLTQAQPGPDAQDDQTLLLARIDKLIALGALDPAQSLIEQAGPERSPQLFSRWFDVTLLTGDEDRVCAVMVRAPHLAPDYSARVFCAARSGEWPTAALLLDNGRVLGLIPPVETALLSRFLDAEDTDTELPLVAPAAVTPLVFRLREAIGEALPAATLPRAFASADLRDLAGWKAQLEAAERLSRSGALPANRLLGIYTARLPAASGGIWDRVEALQRFDTAMNSKSPSAISKTLPLAWQAMQSELLDVSFAQLFASDLAGIALTGGAATIAYEVALMSPGYEIAAKSYAPLTPRTTFLTGLAMGNVANIAPYDLLSEAIADGFNRDLAPPHLKELAAQRRIGEALLRAMALFNQGTKGDFNSLSQALATLRLMGLEDIARRASLQLLLRSPRV
jgi:hypothetical protein